MKLLEVDGDTTRGGTGAALFGGDFRAYKRQATRAAKSWAAAELARGVIRHGSGFRRSCISVIILGSILVSWVSRCSSIVYIIVPNISTPFAHRLCVLSLVIQKKRKRTRENKSIFPPIRQ